MKLPKRAQVASAGRSGWAAQSAASFGIASMAAAILPEPLVRGALGLDQDTRPLA
jgi:hypothetical protein